jgi:hypothetical protein
VLDVVVIRVALVEPGVLAPVEARQVGEDLGQIARGILLVEILVDAADRVGYELRIGRVDPVGDVELVAPIQLPSRPLANRNIF